MHNSALALISYGIKNSDITNCASNDGSYVASISGYKQISLRFKINSTIPYGIPVITLQGNYMPRLYFKKLITYDYDGDVTAVNVNLDGTITLETALTDTEKWYIIAFMFA